MPKKTVLYATDYSTGYENVLEFATNLARADDARLLIAHVTELEQYPVGELFDEEPTPDPEELKRLKAVVPHDPSVAYEHRLLFGEPGSAEITKPADELVKLAKKEEVEVIVLGTHGRSGLKHLLMGSVAEAVVRRAPCRVVTVKLPGS